MGRVGEAGGRYGARGWGAMGHCGAGNGALRGSMGQIYGVGGLKGRICGMGFYGVGSMG